MNAEYRIALIDDDRAWAETLADYLRGKGFSIDLSDDGTSGLALLGQGGIPAAVGDFNMPGLNGLELLRRLRQRGRDATVVLVSGEQEPSLAVRVRAEGGPAFLPKTASPHLLLLVVREALRATEDRRAE